jgi:hypothetical protein
MLIYAHSQITRMRISIYNSYLHESMQELSIGQEISLSAPATTIVSNVIWAPSLLARTKTSNFKLQQVLFWLLDQCYAFFHKKAKREHSVRLYTVSAIKSDIAKKLCDFLYISAPYY